MAAILEISANTDSWSYNGSTSVHTHKADVTDGPLCEVLASKSLVRSSPNLRTLLSVKSSQLGVQKSDMTASRGNSTRVRESNEVAPL
jgi:hypothetical protein